MIKRLRHRLITVAMLALLIVLTVIMATLNALNYQRIATQADTTLALLTEGGGAFPDFLAPGRDHSSRPPLPEDDQPRTDWRPQTEHPRDSHRFSPELPFSSRYFSVSFAADGSVAETDTTRIAAVDEATAISMATALRTGSRDRGYADHYRYARTETATGMQIIFLDCEPELSTFRSFLLRSCATSAGGLAAVFVLIWLLSARIVRPISESYEKQRRFITDAGHELKTPLTIIDADAELLQMEIGEENEWLADIRRQTTRLSRLTADLIYLSRLDEARKPNLLPFPFSDVVSETAQSFAAPMATRSLTLETDIEPMLTLEGDESAIRQLVSILLDNARKYAPADSTIRLSARRTGRSITLTVTNPAPDLTPEQLRHLFDRFYRADPSRTTPGHGLGLSIARAIVAAHKGKISASCSDGRLSLCVTLP